MDTKDEKPHISVRYDGQNKWKLEYINSALGKFIRLSEYMDVPQTFELGEYIRYQFITIFGNRLVIDFQKVGVRNNNHDEYRSIEFECANFSRIRLSVPKFTTSTTLPCGKFDKFGRIFYGTWMHDLLDADGHTLRQLLYEVDLQHVYNRLVFLEEENRELRKFHDHARSRSSLMDTMMEIANDACSAEITKCEDVCKENASKTSKP